MFKMYTSRLTLCCEFLWVLANACHVSSTLVSCREISLPQISGLPNFSFPAFFFNHLYSSVTFRMSYITRAHSVFLNVCFLSEGLGRSSPEKNSKTLCSFHLKPWEGFLLNFYSYILFFVFFFLLYGVYYLQSVSNNDDTTIQPWLKNLLRVKWLCCGQWKRRRQKSFFRRFDKDGNGNNRLQWIFTLRVSGPTNHCIRCGLAFHVVWLAMWDLVFVADSTQRRGMGRRHTGLGIFCRVSQCTSLS